MLRVTGGLDVEQNPVYYFAVEARDRENPDLHDTAAVSIVTQNINDNTPVFSEVVLSLLPLLLLTLSLLPLLLSLLSLLHCLQDTYSWSIAEDTAAGTLIGVVTAGDEERSEEHTSELQSRPHISYAVFCLKKKKNKTKKKKKQNKVVAAHHTNRHNNTR